MYLYFRLDAEELVSSSLLVCHVERLGNVGIVIMHMRTFHLKHFSFQTADQQAVVSLRRHIAGFTLILRLTSKPSS